MGLLSCLSTTEAKKAEKTPKVPAKGWIGGFAESNPEFMENPPNLTSLPMLDNMDNIDKLQRQQGVKWPEFSWLSDPDRSDSRCFQMFAPYISRLGYTNEGRVYSIICPQQGITLRDFATMNIEVTVTGNRGWVNESNKTVGAEMTVEGTIWFSPSSRSNHTLKLLEIVLGESRPFPWSKEHAIKITTHKHGEPDQPIFPVNSGKTTLFEIPDFAIHNEAWSVGNIDVQIGPIKKTGDEKVDDFNQLILDVFNIGSGNMLLKGNTLSWNVWFTAPQHVNQVEWRTHAERWRKSIDVDHRSPTGEGTDARYYDGSKFEPIEGLLEEVSDRLYKFIKKHI